MKRKVIAALLLIDKCGRIIPRAVHAKDNNRKQKCIDQYPAKDQILFFQCFQDIHLFLQDTDGQKYQHCNEKQRCNNNKVHNEKYEKTRRKE